MEIDLRDQLVVLDEAHNVEDSARDAASLTLTAVDLQNVLEDLDKLGNNNNNKNNITLIVYPAGEEIPNQISSNHEFLWISG